MTLYPLGASGTPGVQNPDALGPIAAGGSQNAGPQPDAEHPLRPLVALWLEKLRLADIYKRAKFSEDAAECMQFFSGPYDFLYSKRTPTPDSAGEKGADDDDDMPPPSFRMTVNKVAEAVQIFGPVLYHRNPVRTVNPRDIPAVPPDFYGNPMADPMAAQVAMQAQMSQQGTQQADQLRSKLLEYYLNWTPVEMKLKDHSRKMIDETIIKGMGCLWTELYTPKGLPQRPDGSRFRMVGSFYESVDHLLLDPDAECLDDCKWIARRCIHPAWEVEQQYGLPAGTLQGVAESSARSSELNSSIDGDYKRMQSGSADLVAYWKIYSKMGVGGRLQGVSLAQRGVLDQFGDNCYLVVVEGIPYPLNLPPDLINSADPSAPEAILEKLDWPTPFWADDDWPMTPLIFHEVPRCPWPMSHFKPAMGELKFLNWAYSFLAGKIRTTCRDFLVVQAALDDEFKEAVLHGKDLTLLELKSSHGKVISEVVQFLQHPQINGDVWKVIQAVTENFEKRTGLTELVYGESASSYRSAEEAQVKGSQLQIRPDDMAQRVEDAMTLVARKEAMAARWHLTGQDVAVAMGPVCAQAWDRAVRTQDLFEMCHQLEFRIEADSAKKPNKTRQAANMQAAMQNLFQPLFGYASSTGNVGPVNALITDWAKSIDLKAQDYLLLVPPPPPPPPVVAGKPGEKPAEGGGPPQQGPPPGQGQGPAPARAA